MTHGDICILDFGVPFGSEPGYRRPVALVHQIVVVDKFRLDEKLSKLPKCIMSQIEDAIDYVTKE